MKYTDQTFALFYWNLHDRGRYIVTNTEMLCVCDYCSDFHLIALSYHVQTEHFTYQKELNKKRQKKVKNAHFLVFLDVLLLNKHKFLFRKDNVFCNYM